MGSLPGACYDLKKDWLACLKPTTFKVMGNWYETIVDLDVTEAEAPRLGEQMRVWLIEREIIEAVLTAELGTDLQVMRGSGG